MRSWAPLVFVVVSLGCGNSPQPPKLTMQKATTLYPAFEGEKSELTVKNDSAQDLSLRALLWPGGGDTPASDFWELKPGEELKLKPFATARAYLAVGGNPNSLRWLEKPTPSTDYSLGVLVGNEGETRKLLLNNRFSYDDLLASPSKPIRIVCGLGSADVFRGDQKQVVKYVP